VHKVPKWVVAVKVSGQQDCVVFILAEIASRDIVDLRDNILSTRIVYTRMLSFCPSWLDGMEIAIASVNETGLRSVI
jgi:hypothetical protein